MTFVGASREEAMELVRGLENFPDEDRLRKLGQFSLKKRLSADLLAPPTIWRGKTRKLGHFIGNCSDRTRNNGYKLKQGKFRLATRKKFFTLAGGMRHWHSCPGRLRSPKPWQRSKPGRMGLRTTWSRGRHPCPQRGVGTRWSLQFLPALNSVRSHDLRAARPPLLTNSRPPSAGPALSSGPGSAAPPSPAPRWGSHLCPGPQRDPRPARHRHRSRLPQPSGTDRGAGARDPPRSRPVPSCPRRKRQQRPAWRRRSAVAAARAAAGRSAGLAAMPKYYEDKEEDGRACSGVREDLRQCLLESPCVLQVSALPFGSRDPQVALLRPLVCSSLGNYSSRGERRSPYRSEIAGEVLWSWT